MAMVVNELLAFIQHAIDTMDEVSIMQICKSSFTSEEICAGKQLLYETLGQSANMPLRRRDGGERSVQDIISLLKQTDPDDVPAFVAKDLHKLPVVTMDHVDVSSLLKNFNSMKAELVEMRESDPRIVNVNIDRRTPCDRVVLSNWEQKHSVSLPEDLRNFYASTDGFQLNWDYKYTAEEILPVGSIQVNTINELCMSPALKDLIDFALTRQNSGSRPFLNTKSKIFELDDCRNIGKICLIYSNGSWSIWLVTRDGAWGWLADSFTHYFRMSLVHLGLPGWQAVFANLPLIPWTEQLFLLLAPYLLEKTEPENAISAVSETGFNHIDPNIFKTTSRQHKNTKTANN